MIERPIFIGYDAYFVASIFGIIFGWPKRHDNGVYGTHIDSQVFDPNRACVDSSVTRRRAFLPCGDGQKNDLRAVRLGAHGLVRPSRAPDARSAQRSDAYHHAILLAPFLRSPRSKPTAVVSAAIQPATGPDRTRLQADPTPRNAQPVLRDTSRSAQSRQRLLRWLAPTQQSAAPTMLHYLRRCV